MTSKSRKDNPCKRCDAICCKHVAMEIDKPETRGDFDDIRWYLAHKKVSVFTEDGDWFVQFKSPCRYLTADNRCSIYENRPRICRQHSTDGCELTGEDDPDDLNFTKPEQIEAYAKQYLRDKRRKASKKKRKKK